MFIFMVRTYITHSTNVLVCLLLILSCGFIVDFYINFLLNLYMQSTFSIGNKHKSTKTLALKKNVYGV